MNVWDSNILLLILLLNRVQCGSQQNVRHCLGKIPFGILTASDELMLWEYFAKIFSFLLSACVMLRFADEVIPFSYLHHSSTSTRFLELKAVARLGGPLGRGPGHQQERSALLAGILL